MAKNTKVTIKGTSQARDRLIKFINEQSSDKTFLDDQASFTVDQMVKRIRARKEEYAQQALTKYSIKRRKSLIKSGNAFDQKVVKDSRSNLSLSGQLLNAISFRVNNSIREITIFIKKARNPYKGIKGKSLENKKDNLEIKDDLSNLGREFFFISDKLKLNLENRITIALRKKLALYNRIKRKLLL